MDLAGAGSQFLILYADCVPVKGLRRSAIYDLTRHEVHLFPTDFYPLLEWLTTRAIAEIQDGLSEIADDVPAISLEAVNDFIDFLIENELALLTEDPSRFPRMAVTWDFPGDIQNAIIDVDAVLHDFDGLISQLDLLGCQFIQIRGFSSLLTLEVCKTVLARAARSGVESIELIVQHRPSVPFDRYRLFLKEQPLVTSLTVHSVPADAPLSTEVAEWNADGVRGDLHFTSQVIDSETHCGVITPRHLNAPSVSTYSEFRLFNGCLNRKIAIDATGEIRNCPSMRRSFGHASDQSLQEIVRSADFVRPWHIGKDQIDVCRECEFRYMCSDCRAYLDDPADEYSKPLKCGYDPARATWDSRHRPELKWAVRDAYGASGP